MVDQDMSDDLRGRVVELEHKTANNDQRVVALEVWRTQRDIESARHDERWKHMDKRFDDLDGKVGKINDTMTWVARAVVGAILISVVAFMMKGGFSI